MLSSLGPLQVAIAILGIGFLIGWHEFGHYIVARLLGMRVIRYSIGIGPKIWGFTKSGIEYQIAAIPVLGFVKVKGMTPFEEDDALTDPRSFINRPRWARFLMLAAGPGFNYLAAFVLFFAYQWAWPSPLPTTTVELSSVSANFPCDADAQCPTGEQCVALPDVKNKKVCAPDAEHTDAASIATPALKAGLQPGDLVTMVDGQPLNEFNDFINRIVEKNGATVRLHILRGNEERDIDVTPAKLGGENVKIGVSPTVREPRAGFFETLRRSGIGCMNDSIQTLLALKALVYREPGVQVGSSVMIVAEMKEEIAKGPRFFVKILAGLSVNLGLLNLLPVPALDGIKMLFLAVEGSIRRNINANFQVWVNGIGLLALLGLMVVLMARDTLHLIG